MNAQEAVRLVQQVAAWLQPYVEHMIGAPMPYFEVRPRGKTPYRTAVVMNADRKHRHWLIEVYPAVIEKWFKRGDYARLLLCMCHELFHPYSLEALRHHLRLDWQQMVFNEEIGPLDAEDPITPYYGWSEGSANVGELILAISLFQNSYGTEFMANVVGRRRMIKANDSLEHHVASELANMLEALYRHKLIHSLQLTELQLPVKLPRPFVRHYSSEITKWAQQRLRYGAPDPDYTDNYHVFCYYGMQAIRRGRLSLRELILAPHTNARMKELALG
jgi:hypothetical protein